MQLKGNIFLLSNGDFGAAYRLKGVADEPLLAQDLIQQCTVFTKGFSQIICGIPSNVSKPNCQIQILASNRKIRAKCDVNQLDLANQILSEEENYLHENTLISSRHLYLFVRCTPPKPDSSAILSTIKSVFKKDFEEHLAANETLAAEYSVFREYMESLEVSLKSQIDTPLDYTQLVEVIRLCLNCDGESPIAPSPFEINRDVHFDIDSVRDGSIVSKDGRMRSVYFPESVSGNFSHGLLRHFMDTIPCADWDLVWTISSGQRAVSYSIRSDAKYYAKGSYPEEDRSHSMFIEEINSQNPQVSMAVRLVVHNERSDFETKLKNLSLDHLGSIWRKERHIALHMLLTSLPLNSPLYATELKGRFHYISLEKSAMFMPIYTSDKTDGKYHFQTRQNLATTFDLFKGGEVNKNMAIIGIPGSGKSTMLGHMCLNFMASNPDGLIRIVDFGYSFRKLCDLFGGRFIDFTPDYLRENIFSPFALTEWGENEIETVKHFVCTIIEAKNPDAKWQTIHDQILINSIKLAFNRYRRELDESNNGQDFDVEHPKWDEIKTNFSQTTADYKEGGYDGFEAAVEEITRWTMSFDESGEYDFIFNATEDLTKSKGETPRLIVYNLGGIGSDPVLRVMASMLINMRILKDIAGNPKVKKLVFNDELGTQIKGSKDQKSSKISDSASHRQAEAITSMYETARKLNVQNVVASPSVSDYVDVPAGKTVWSLCTQYIFFGMGSMVNDRLKQEWDFLNEADWSIIRDMRIDLENKRTSCYLISDTAAHSLRVSLYVPLSPYMDAILTTNRSSLSHYMTKLKEGRKPNDICREMATNYPYGKGML